MATADDDTAKLNTNIDSTGINFSFLIISTLMINYFARIVKLAEYSARNQEVREREHKDEEEESYDRVDYDSYPLLSLASVAI